MRYRKSIVLTLVFTLFILTAPAQMLASAAVRPWGGSVGSWEDAIKEWQSKEWKDQPPSSAEQQWLDYLKQNHPELYDQYINEWLNEVKKTDPALYEQYMRQWKNGQGDFSPFDGTLSPLDGNYLQWQQLKLRELQFNTLAPAYNGPLGAILPSLLMTGSLFAPKGMEFFSIFNRTVSGDNNAFSLFAPLSPQELMMNQLFSLSFMKGVRTVQTSGDDKSEATEKHTSSASNNGGTITDSKQEDKPWYKKAGDWIGNQYKSVKDTAHSNPVTGEVWDFLIADAEGTITGVDPITGEKLSGMGRTYNIATTVFKPLKVVDKIADGANAAKKAEKIKDTKKQSVGRKEEDGKKEEKKEESHKINNVQEVKYGDHYTKQGRRTALKPNVKYTTKEDYHYSTDGSGRIKSVEAKLELGTVKRNPHAQRTVGREDRLPTDNGGHLIASIFKGSGGYDNLVPMDENLNKSAYKKLENTWREALKEGKEVKVRVRPVYKGDSLRPTRFEIRYTINKDETIVDLKNSSGGK